MATPSPVRLLIADRSENRAHEIDSVLRNAGMLLPRVRPDIVVCWGGHSIGRDEYIYTKKVGYELGLRGLNVCTGCGPGAMKGPMKGAAIRSCVGSNGICISCGMCSSQL